MGFNRYIVSTLSVLMFAGCAPEQGTQLEPATHVINLEVNEVEKIRTLSDKEPLKLNIFSWTPDGKRKRESSANCRAYNLENSLENVKSGIERKEIIDQYISECGNELSHGINEYFHEVYRMANIFYYKESHPNINKIEVIFNNGEKISGLLAVHPDDVPRPLVIARCGVFCDYDDKAFNFMLMHLFDESPFHVLVLESTTGYDYLNLNKRISIGGYYEGIQHFQIYNFLKNNITPLTNKVSSLHSFGISLGSNSSLMTGVLSENNKDEVHQDTFNSVIGMCPVINLHKTLDHAFRNTFRGQYFAAKSWKIVKSLYQINGLAIPSKVPIREYPNFIGSSAKKSYEINVQSDRWAMKPFLDMDYKSLDQVWAVNDYTQFIRNTKTPTFILGSVNDKLVPQRTSGMIAEEIWKEQPNDFVTPVMTEKGGHCANGITYGWDTNSTLFKNFILTHSPDLKSRELTKLKRVAKWLTPEKLELQEHEKFYSYYWLTEPLKNTIDLVVEIWSPQNGFIMNCNGKDPRKARNSCFRKQIFTLDIDSLGFPKNRVSVPISYSHAQSMQRWLNNNVQLLTENLTPWAPSNETPFFFRWKEYSKRPSDPTVSQKLLF